MTDKQIIIDGVPVQDCLFLATNKMGDDIGTYCRDFNGSCKNIQNCYFKRWQRKEQECEELKRIRDGNFLHALEEQDRADKLSKTLTEIKDFFKEECLICKENYINITGEICKECKYQDILRKINEVE